MGLTACAGIPAKTLLTYVNQSVVTTGEQFWVKRPDILQGLAQFATVKVRKLQHWIPHPGQVIIQHPCQTVSVSCGLPRRCRAATRTLLPHPTPPHTTAPLRPAALPQEVQQEHPRGHLSAGLAVQDPQQL